MAKAKNIYYGTGRRKASIAKVRLVSGTGKITVNGMDVHEYLPYETLIMNLSQPLELTNTKEIFDVEKISNKIFKKGIALSECNNIFNQFETIKIPHVGKSDHFKYEDLLKIEYDAIEISNKNHNNFKSVIKQKDFKKSIVAFSDTHDWKRYPQARTLITEIDQMEEISFKELKRCLQKNKDYTINRS